MRTILAALAGAGMTLPAATAVAAEVAQHEAEPRQSTADAAYRATENAESVHVAQASDELPRGVSIDEVVVTGTHIRGVESASPVLVYDARRIEQSGYSSTQQFLAAIPQNWSGAASDQSASAQVTSTDPGFPGESSPNVHGLGSGATLTLINGRRLATAGYGTAADVSMLPLSMIERIELLTDGASALYGSDAIAGVVNFVLKKELSGAETLVEYGDASSGAHARTRISQAFGHNWASGNALFAYDYAAQSELRSEDRDFVPASAQGTYLVPATERHSSFLTLRQEVDEHSELYGHVLYSHKTTDSVNVLAAAADNTADQYAASIGLARSLGSGWDLDFSATLGDSRLDELNTFRGAVVSNLLAASRQWSGNLLLTGDLLSLPGGNLKLAAGGEYREETLDRYNRRTGTHPADEQRSVEAAFAELSIPLFDRANRRTLLRELSFSAAGRYERYSDFGGTSTEKFGVRWRPLPAVLFRATTGTAFHAPTLLTGSTGSQAVIFPLQDPRATPVPLTTSLLMLGANSNLGPETARTTSLGLDIRPESMPAFDLSLTYFKTHYRDKIQAPAPTFLGMLVNESAYADFIVRNPTLDQVNALIAQSDSFLNPRNLPVNSVRAIVNDRVQNVAAVEVRGWDLGLDYRYEAGFGVLGLSLAAEHLTAFEQRLTRTSPEMDVSDTVFNPPSWKARADASWSWGGYSISTAVNHVGDYRNTAVSPSERVDAFRTVDLRAAYEFSGPSSSLLSDFAVALSATNLLDRSPPRVRGALAGYDATNASPFERVVTVQVRKRW